MVEQRTSYDENPSLQESQKRKVTGSDLKGLLEQGFEDPVWFLGFYLEHLFPGPIPWVHRGLLALATRKTDFLLKYGELDKIIRHFVWKEDPDDPNSAELPLFTPVYNEQGQIVSLDLEYTKNTLVMMPRGFSKTTLYGIGVILYFILYLEQDFIVYLSETASHAEMQLNNVKAELESNEIIRAVFGNVVPDRQDSRKWTSTMFETLTDVVVVSRGRGGQVRGLNHKGKRPSVILFDDVEDKESVRTAEQRDKTREWMYSDVMPALAKMRSGSRILGLGTLLHREALLTFLMKDPKWTACVFGAIDKDGDPLWEANMSLADIEKEKQSYILAGKLPLFYMEYMSQIRGEDAMKFKQSFFIIDPFVRDEMLGIAQVIDPAISDKPDADFCAIGVVGMSEKGRIGVLDLWGKVGAEPREQIDRYFELSIRNNVLIHGVEAIAYQKALKFLIKEEMFRKGKYFEIEEIRHGRTGKDERILGILQGRYANGYIVHARRFPQLEEQLLDYPGGKKDFPDVIAMCISLLDPYAAAAADPDKDLGADEAPPLLEVFKGNWRAY